MEARLLQPQEASDNDILFQRFAPILEQTEKQLRKEVDFSHEKYSFIQKLI